MNKEAFIFDFFDVVHEDPLKVWCKKYGLKREDGIDDIAFRLDTGVISYRQYVEELARLINQTAAQLDEEFATAVLNRDMVELIKKIQTTHKTALLSNTNHEEIDSIFERHGLVPIFHEIVISSDVGLTKPDPKIYGVMLDRLGVKPQQAVFIDDNPVNVTAAETLGIDSIRYTDMESLYEALQKAGLDDLRPVPA